MKKKISNFVGRDIFYVVETWRFGCGDVIKTTNRDYAENYPCDIDPARVYRSILRISTVQSYNIINVFFIRPFLRRARLLLQKPVRSNAIGYKKKKTYTFHRDRYFITTTYELHQYL